MSNYKAVATVTATLSKIVQEAINTHIGTPISATVSHLRPDASGIPTPGVNIFLYQVTTNPAWRNVDLPARNAAGQLVTRPKVALDLHFLLSFYGNDTLLEPQQLLAQTVSALHAKPVLSRTDISNTLADGTHDYLDGSDLADEVELVKFTPLPLSLEELSKLWSVFFQTHYTLSIAYHATVVLLDSTLIPVTPLPVRARTFSTILYYTIEVNRVANDTDPALPIEYDSTLAITGRGLQGETTLVRIAGEEITVAPENLSESKITLPLSSVSAGALRAGVQGLQIVHKVSMGLDSPTLHNGVESAVVPFVIRPSFEVASEYNEILGTTTIDFTSINPELKKGQRVLVLLNNDDPAVPASYSMVVPVPDDTDTFTMTFDDGDLTTTPGDPGKYVRGTYFVRMQVDGAESILDVGAGAYTGPKIGIGE